MSKLDERRSIAARLLRIITAVALVAIDVGCSSTTSDPVEPVVHYRVHGVVSDGFAQPIPGATISLGGASTSTDVGGQFEFVDIAPGSYQMTATCAGYDVAPARTVIVDRSNVVTELALVRIWDWNMPLHDAHVQQFWNRVTGYLYGDENYGSGPFLNTGTSFHDPMSGSSTAYLALIAIDLSGIPNAALILSARLEMTISAQAARQIDLTQILGPWTEYGVIVESCG